MANSLMLTDATDTLSASFEDTLLGSTGRSHSTRTQRRSSYTGVVDRVWEDGLFLNTDGLDFRVDTWYVYRDSTERFVSVGDQVTVTGEFERGEFDAFSITVGNSNGSSPGSNGSDDDDDAFGDNSDNILRGSNRSDDIRGRGGNDRLIGRGGGDDLFGDDGNDILVGGGGGDDLFGGAGRDVLRGGRGNDDLVGGAGRDILIGNADRDTFVLQPGGNDIIRDFLDGVDELGLSGGINFNDLAFQQRGSNTLILAEGNRVALMLDVNANSITRDDLD